MNKIIVDHRERASGIIKELAKKGMEIEIKQLIAGDFIIQSKDMNEKIVNVGIEKKTQTDFLNSIIDKRIITQLIRLKENFDIPLLVIEGSENMYEMRNFHPNAIRGMMASIAIDFQIPIIFTKNKRDTASLIKIITTRLERPIKNISLLTKKKPLTTKEQQEYIISSLPGVGPTLAKSLLKKFKSVEKIINAKREDLMLIDKIGKKKAETIKELLKACY
jgi:Fanconi anemia group M protein